MSTFLLISLCVLILFSAFTSGSETALFSLSSMKVRAFKTGTRRQRLVAKLISQPQRLLVTVMMINVVMNILIQNVVSNIFDRFDMWLINVGVPLAITLIFGEVIPKSIGLANNAEVAPIAAPFLNVSQKVLYPIREVLVKVTNFLSRTMFFFLEKEKEVSVEELQHTLKSLKKLGVVSKDEARLMRGYLDLEEMGMKELMRPREEIIFYNIKQPLDELIDLFIDQECTRLPVCDGELDNVLGIITTQQFFLHRHELKDAKDVRKILIKPYFVPESMTGEALLYNLYQKKETIALVVDEYGVLSGLIALEDLTEEVIGEITDRRDEKRLYTKSGDDVIIASGKLELSELEEIFDTTFPSEQSMVTVGGWLTEKVGDIPKSGTKYTTESFLFHVLSSDPTRVRRVYIRRLKKKK